MEGRLFTFLGAIGGHGQEWIILSHYILVLGIIFLIARAATRKLQLVPTGAQNVMETFVGGIVKWELIQWVSKMQELICH